MVDSSNVVPFGKYKGQSVEVLRRDTDYVDWCMMQGIHHQYPMAFGLHVTVQQSPLGLLEPTETPEHNRYQALFLNEQFAADVYRTVKEIGEYPKVSFEAGLSVYWQRKIRESGISCVGSADVQLDYPDSFPIRVEIKPVMGDDYPVVLRQMQSSLCKILYLVNYTGSVPLDQVRQIFTKGEPVSIGIVMHRDFWEVCPVTGLNLV